MKITEQISEYRLVNSPSDVVTDTTPRTISYAELFRNFKQLVNNKLILKPLQPEMAEELFEATYESRSELYKFMSWSNESIEDAKTFISQSVIDREKGTALKLAVFEKDTETLVGGMFLKHIDIFTPKAEIGYWIRTSRAGCGYATNVIYTMIKFCRDKLNLVRLDACAAANNIASQKVLLKCGFKEEGLKLKAQLCHGVWLDLKLFGLILS